MTKKELIEIIEFLTEQCVNKIVYDLNDIAFTPYMAKYEDWEGTLNPSSVEVYNYYERVRSYFINQLLAKDKKELTEEEYQRVIDEYELKFVDKFGEALTDKFLDDDSEYSEEEFFDDDFEELDYDEKIAELYKRIDLLDEEYIKKIVDEIGCCSYNIMEPDRWLEEYDEEGERFTPQFKQARELLVEYFDRRWILIDKLEEVDGGDPNNYYLDLNHAFAQKYIEYWTSKE